MEYFDAFIIGLTATPEKRTFAFFNQNVVSEYSREKAIIDRVNVGEDIYLINTEITQNGAMIMKRLAEYRDRLTRAKRWRQTYRDKVFTELFPRRKNVPKTLIFAKNDSHADDIVQIVREVFGEGNEFCQKITCKAKKADEALSNFRNQFYPRIAVTVEMIATGTDVKPLECLIFMRDVRSKGHYEQMLGRGTRVLKLEDLKMVSGDDATEKDHFVVIKSFHAFIEENKDEIFALRIIYDQRYADRPMAIKKLKELYEKLQQEHIAIERLWDCYAIKKPDKVKPFFGQKGLVRALL